MTYPHWQYFLAIESDLENTASFVEIAKDNFCTFSIEYVRILLSASSETDVISKLVCERIDSTRTYNNIDQYRQRITAEYPKLFTMEVLLPRYGLTLKPWENWGHNINPSWWKSYNNVKHQRNDYYNEANLENALNSVAGLFCMVLYYYEKDARANKLDRGPKILHLEKQPTGFAFAQGYGLPDF
jgi:hypothetical protein